PGDQRKVGRCGFQLYPVGIHQFQLTAGGGRGGHGLHPHKTGGPFIFLPEFSEPVVDGGQGNAPGCADCFLALRAVRKFLQQEAHPSSVVQELRFSCKAIGQEPIGTHVRGGAHTLKVGKAMPLDALNSFWLCPLSANSSIRRAISSLLSINFVFMHSYRTENYRKTCTWWGGYGGDTRFHP